MTQDFDETNRGRSRDRETWARARQEWRKSVESQLDSALDPNDLAAYLEGRLEGAALERVEAWMAGSETALDLTLAARDGLTAAPLAAPDRVVQRAQAMVGHPAVPERSGWWQRLISGFGFGELAPLAQAGAFAVMALICYGAFELGHLQGRDLTAPPDPVEVADLSFTVTLEDFL